MQEKLQNLQTRLKEVHNINKASSVLWWDQQVNMPDQGAAARAERLATLDKISHEKFTTDEIGELLEALSSANFDYDSDEGSLIRLARRKYEKARKLPPDLVAEMSHTFSIGQQQWAKARAENDFSQFQNSLTKIVALNLQKAEAYGYEDTPYDALLDDYEPTMTTAEVSQVFSDLKADLLPLVQVIGSQIDAIDDSMLYQKFDVQAQWDFGLMVLDAIGFDLERGRQDKSVHPFTSSFAIDDVRITTRIYEDNLPSGLFSTLHEAGHALYEQNISPSLEGNILASGTSLGIHESQSRLWENVVGRSKPFWQYYYPHLQRFFPEPFMGVDLELFYRAINKVTPSYIRVEADELTYNLHIFLRFELEQELLTGRLAVADLPQAWNAKIESYLGLPAPDDAQGVLQDIHWSAGMMGYFPTYTLGNVLSLQFYQQTLQDIPDLPDQFARGEFGALLNWFQDKIHRHGKKFTAMELVKRVTGADHIEATPYLTYIKQKISDIYQ